MRLTESRLKWHKVYKHEPKTTNEGARVQGYSDTPIEIKAIIWPAGGRIQAAMYGDKLAYMMNMLCYLDTGIKEKDGIAVYTQDKPDYRVESIKPWSEHMQVELEAIRGGK